jgi:hypothetical protein
MNEDFEKTRHLGAKFMPFRAFRRFLLCCHIQILPMPICPVAGSTGSGPRVLGQDID